MEGDIPEGWKELLEAQNQQQFRKENFQSIYTKYKDATDRFFHYMMDQCPVSIRGEQKSVNSLLIAADWMADTRHVITDRSILNDLRLAIRTRHKVAKSVFGGGDAGHKYLLSILVYCWTIMKGLPVLTSSETTSQRTTGKEQGEAEEAAEEDGNLRQENKYLALMEEEEDDEEDVDEEMFPSNPIPRPEPEAEPMTLDQLLKSDDRHDAILFLVTLDEFMGFISDQYKVLRQTFADYKQAGVPESGIMEKMLEAAVATNMAIQQVQQLEMELTLRHAHLKTPYCLLATLVLPEITQKLTATVREHATKQCTEKDIYSFLGDCLECHFRSPSDQFNKKESIVRDVSAEWELDAVGMTELEEIFSGLGIIVFLEVPIAQEEKDNSQVIQLLRSSGLSDVQSHTWIKNMPFIGGDRAIHHTLRLLQSLGPVIHGTPMDKTIKPRQRGFFGPPWRPGRDQKLRDLDELFMSDILPDWVTLCRHGIFAHSHLPRQDELCPLFVILKQYIMRPEEPTTWSLAFAMHALLTAVFETDAITDKLLAVNKIVFDMYFENVQWAQKVANVEEDSLESLPWRSNMSIMMFLKNLGLQAFDQWTLWNPLCGGTILSYLTFFGNLEVGCTLIDCHAQLRIVLHLFHALVVNGIITKGQIPMLDMLYESFKGSKGLWEGSPPQNGEFVQRFWICFGASYSEAKQMAEEARRDIRTMQRGPSMKSRNNNNTRRMNPIEAAEISKSYRRICNRDFRGVVDKYHTPDQRRRNKGTDQYLLAVRTNDTLDAIENEQRLLSFNLPTIGVLLEQFVCSLGRILQWEPILAMHVAPFVSDGANLKRQGFVYLFAQYLLGALDFAQDPYSYVFLRVPLVEASTHFMNEMFNRLEPQRCMWFQVVEEE